ncbi:hypothetical protein [Kineosporia sp. NBRC 101731]|nr:hypothetical protein [Kineosporia sp. NBRC 101731]GLY31650.1 hypothetical protein Kisp02_50150 [Kineosporia sp. NBRC 101731]
MSRRLLGLRVGVGVGVGATLFLHGAQKLLGRFGGGAVTPLAAA